MNLCGEFLEHALKIKTKPAGTPLIRYFKLPTLFPVHLSFACGHLACPFILTIPAAPSRIRRTTCSTTHKIRTAFNANRHYTAYQIFLAAPLFSVHLSFACRHLACPYILTIPAAPSRIRRTTCSTTHKTCTAFNANRPLPHLSDILSCPFCLRFIFRLLAGIWPAIFLTTPATLSRIRRTTCSTIHKI